MRRRCVVLVAVVALVLLFPSAALGARPVFQVTGITVTSTGSQGTDYAGEAMCGWTATVVYVATGRRAAEVAVRSQDLVKIDSTNMYCPLQADGDTTFSGTQQVMYGDPWQWSAFLLSRDGFHTVSPIAVTGTYTFTRFTCPQTGTVIAVYP